MPPAELHERAKRAGAAAPPPKDGAVRRQALEFGPGSSVHRATDRRIVAAQRAGASTTRRPTPSRSVAAPRRRGRGKLRGRGALHQPISCALPTSRNLVRVFLLQDRLKGLGGKSAAEFRHVHVIGAGVMGGDIAAWCGIPRHDGHAAGSLSADLIAAGHGPRQGFLRQAPQRPARRRPRRSRACAWT